MTRLLLAVALSAAELFAQKTVRGTLTEFRTKSLEFGMKADSGESVFFKVGPLTQVVRIPPGDIDLTKAAPSSVTDLAIGDRVLVSFVEGLAEPRRIVRISATDIERRNEAERLDWERRGISGIVTGKTADTVNIELRTPAGAHKMEVAVSDRTAIRRYAPDSVKFTDAVAGRMDDIALGDQLRTRGDRNPEGTRVAAEDIVFGTFLTSMGPITAVNLKAGEVQIRDLQTKASMTIRLTADSRLRKMPEMREMFAQMMKGGKPAAGKEPEPAGIAQMLDRLPPCGIGDLKVGSTIVVTSTRGLQRESATAILLVANVDGLIRMAQAQAGQEGLSPVEAISHMHHGMMDAPGGGLSLPAMMQ